ncbi:MAG: glycosyltransferase [Saprospiraceae bacterium]|nr:glycosyltransferase [Saprospiraceae bacterium]
MILATTVQLVYWWGVFARLAFYDPAREKVGLPGSPQAGASVLICARNEAANLRDNLPHILEQAYSGLWEVIVIDDASTDGTAAVLEQLQQQYSRLRVLRVAEKTFPGKKHALAQGIAAARYEHLFFTDADCRPASGQWLSCMAAALLKTPETEIALGYAPMRREVRWGGRLLNGWARFETAQTAIQYFSFALSGWPYMGVGRNLAWKKSLFNRSGGFSRHLHRPSGDDDLLVNATAHAGNTAICLQPESFMYSDGERSWPGWLRQKRRQLDAGKRYRPAHQLALAVLSLSHTLHYFLLLVLLIAGFGMITAAFCYLLRSVSLLFLYGKILPKLREQRLLSQVPIYDTLFAAYYGAFVPLFLINNRHAHTWK